MRYVYIALALFGLVLIAPAVSGQPIYERTDDVYISHPIRGDSEGIVENVTANITIRNPRGDPIVLFEPFTFNESTKEHEYILDSSETNLTGDYPYTITVEDDTIGNQTESFTFTVTQTGKLLGTGNAIIHISVFGFSLFFFILTLTSGILIPWRHNRRADGIIQSVNDWKFAKIGLLFVAYISLTWVTWMGYNIVRAYSTIQVGGEMLYGIFWFLISGLFPIIVVGLIITIMTFLDNLRKKDLLRQGIPTQ